MARYMVSAVHGDGTRTMMLHDKQRDAINHMQYLLRQGAKDVHMYEEAPIHDAKTVLQACHAGAIQPV